MSTLRGFRSRIGKDLMKKFATFAAVSALALFAATAQAEEPTGNTVVATVNGTDITLSHMIITMAQLPAQYQQLPPEVLWDGILEQLIQQQLLADEMTNLPARAQYAIENETRSIKAGERISVLSEAAVTEEALQAAYDAQFADAEPTPEYNASHILLATQEEALAAKARVDAGEDFATVATELSTGPSGPNGGQLGWFGPGMMVEPFEQAVVAMEVGTVSEPVETQFGWHIIKLNETRDQANPTLDDMRDELAAKIQEEMITTYLAQITSDSDITRIEAGSIDPAALTNLDLLEQ